MALLLALIVGIAVGGIGGFLLNRRYELVPINVFLGVAGAIIGDVFYFFAAAQDSLLFSWGGLACQALGAAVFVFIFSFFRRAKKDLT